MFDNKLREPHFQQLFRETAQNYNLEVPSIAMSGFYGQSFLDRANYKELVRDCLDAMKVMGAKVAFLLWVEWKQAGRKLRNFGQL